MRKKLRLGAMVSSGKDSIFAMYSMLKKGYEIACIITIKSANPESFMFHTPGVEMVQLQAKAIGLPLIVQKTAGMKETELKDLKAALERAKQLYKIEGIVTGAIFSMYQKRRFEKIAKALSLKVFSPLWHMDQEAEMRAIIKEGFRFIITKIAAHGLDKSWLGKVITEKDVDRLVELSKRFGINIAFEGGEAETLVVDGPIFKKKIKIVEAEIKEESECVAELIIKKAELV